MKSNELMEKERTKRYRFNRYIRATEEGLEIFIPNTKDTDTRFKEPNKNVRVLMPKKVFWWTLADLARLAEYTGYLKAFEYTYYEMKIDNAIVVVCNELMKELQDHIELENRIYFDELPKKSWFEDSKVVREMENLRKDVDSLYAKVFGDVE